MDLPVNPPILPMLAKRVDELPAEGDWVFEPNTQRSSADGARTKSLATAPMPSLKLLLRKSWRRFFHREGESYSFAFFFFQRSLHSRVGSSSGSGVSCGGRFSSGT